MRQRNFRNVLFVSISQFWTIFSFNFVLVFLPFLVRDISPYSSGESLIWVGLIMGAPSFFAALFSTFWGSLASRFGPKNLYMKGLLCQCSIVFLMGFVTSLPGLLLLRIIQGMLGGLSTVGLIIVSNSSTEAYTTRDIGFFQNALTLGQLLGPPAGAIAASTIGYRGAFLSSASLILMTLVFCHLYIAEIPGNSEEDVKGTGPSTRIDKRTVIGWGLCFVATVQLMFLPSVLPDVFEGFKIDQSVAIRLAGLVVMLYTATALVGTYIFCRISAFVKPRNVIIFVSVAGVFFQVLLATSDGVKYFVVMRLIQTAAIAATIPLVFAVFSSDASGKIMGFLNSARFAGNALGPMIATLVLSLSNLSSLYISIGAISLLSLLSYVFYFDEKGRPAGES